MFNFREKQSSFDIRKYLELEHNYEKSLVRIFVSMTTKPGGIEILSKIILNNKLEY